MSGTGNKYL